MTSVRRCNAARLPGARIVSRPEKCGRGGSRAPMPLHRHHVGFIVLTHTKFGMSIVWHPMNKHGGTAPLLVLGCVCIMG
jgi:hypothetical protein